jgi:hypothetical protein
MRKTTSDPTSETEPLFEIRLREETVAAAGLASAGIVAECEAVVDENNQYSFRLRRPSHDERYRVRIGDVSTQRYGLDVDLLIPEEFEGTVEWRRFKYFESCVGAVELILLSQSQSNPEWIPRIRSRLFVYPSKLGRQRYEAMIADLRRISGSVIFDYVSKITRNIDFKEEALSAFTGSLNAEVRLLEVTWDAIARPYKAICEDPMRGLRRVRTFVSPVDCSILDASSFARLAEHGIDPRVHVSTAGVRVPVMISRETLDILEHQIIRGALVWVCGKASDCRRRIHEKIRTRADAFVPTQLPEAAVRRLRLEAEDEMQALKRLVVRVRTIERHIQSALRSPLIRDAATSTKVVVTPIFQHVQPYRHMLRAFLRYARAAYWTISEGSTESIKQTSKLYEIWVYIQIVAAFKALGFSATAIDGLYQADGERSLTLEFAQDTVITLTNAKGTRVRVRYDPWIEGRDLALKRRDGLCFSRSGGVVRPDVVIEFLRGYTEASIPIVSYAAVIDAKYRRVDGDDLDKLQKYHRLASSVQPNGPDVALQLWLAHPANDEIVCYRQEWGERAPSPPQDLPTDGFLGLRPPEVDSGEGASTQPGVAAIRFVSQLLAWLEGSDVLSVT